jgi:hypothetical protein
MHRNNIGFQDNLTSGECDSINTYELIHVKVTCIKEILPSFFTNCEG